MLMCLWDSPCLSVHLTVLHGIDDMSRRGHILRTRPLISITAEVDLVVSMERITPASRVCPIMFSEKYPQFTNRNILSGEGSSLLAGWGLLIQVSSIGLSCSPGVLHRSSNGMMVPSRPVLRVLGSRAPPCAIALL